jgi:hypothetical protein
MTPLREAVVLPILFLTVMLVAGIQLGAGPSLVAPSLFSLVLATMLLAALVRSGTLAPDRLLHASRGSLANANGAVVLVTLFAASAQLLTRLTPVSGLPLFFVDLFLLVLLANTLVAMPDRVRLLRSLAVILGAAFVVKFVVLAGLSDPSSSRLTRVLIALFDAGTFGTIAQQPAHPAAGYLAFVAIALFLMGVAALPAATVTALTHGVGSRFSDLDRPNQKIEI